MKASPLFLVLAATLINSPLLAEAVKDREGAVRADRAKMENDDRWIYNDVDAGFAEAKRTGKPLLVVLRCVPCKACMGIDASVLASSDLQPLLDQFVCVRVINVNALDLSKFQFDYDLSFSTLFFNGDGTIYGRYGSWQHQRDEYDTSIASYKAALSAALAVHQGYPSNKSSLAPKQGGATPFKTPIEIPTLAGKYERDLNWEGNVVKSCVHCHQVGDAFRTWYRNESKPLPVELIYPMPPPETIGMELDPQHVAKVAAVAQGSAAAAAGLRPGDDLLAVDGAPLVSSADVAWALHRFPEEGDLRLSVRRGDATEELRLKLQRGWRLKTDISTRVGTWAMRAMATGGLVLKSLPADQRTRRKIGENELGLLIDRVGEYGSHGAAKRAGFKKDDVLLSIEGIAGAMTESELIGQLLLTYPQKKSLETIVLRENTRIELQLPMQ